MIKAVLFDLDMTLLDRETSLQRFVVDQHARLGVALGHIPRADYLARFVALDSRGYVWKDKVYQQLCAEFGVTGLTWPELLADYLSGFSRHCVPFPHLHELLAELREADLKLGLITNGFGDFQLANVRALGIEGAFHAILVSEWEGVKKPDPEIFHRGLQRLGVTAAESVYVGDHPVNDVAAAQQVGMAALWKRHGKETPPADASGVVDDLLEVAAWILSHGGICPCGCGPGS